MKKSVVVFLFWSVFQFLLGVEEALAKTPVNLYYLVLGWRYAVSLYLLGSGVALYIAWEAHSQ